MAAFSLPLLPSYPALKNSSCYVTRHLFPFPTTISAHFKSPQFLPPPQASRRISNYTREAGLLADAREWSGFSGYDDEDDSDDEDNDDRSLDLLVRFIQNVFRKISRRARKAVRSVLPVSFSAKLVRFSVNGVIILAFLWILKAFLEVVCTLGTVVFVSILLIRGIWTGLIYLQGSRNFVANRNNHDTGAWTGAQPA